MYTNLEVEQMAKSYFFDFILLIYMALFVPA